VSVDVGRKSAFISHFLTSAVEPKKIFAYFSSMNSYVRTSNPSTSRRWRMNLPWGEMAGGKL
jgi:hypothetical protein